jgi:hypothetical protein
MIRYTSTADDDCDNNEKDNNDGDDGDNDVDDNKHEVANEGIVNVKDSATEVIFEDSMVRKHKYMAIIIIINYVIIRNIIFIIIILTSSSLSLSITI